MPNRRDLQGLATEWLVTNGYDGLYNADMGCGCRVGDLMCCTEPQANCAPGYRVGCDEHCEFGGGCEFHISPEKSDEEPDE